MYDISFRQIDYFLKTADCGSISNAARMCFTSQSVVSKWIMRMEAELGAPLFRRGKNGVSLTEEGQLLEQRLRPIFNEMNSAIVALRELHGQNDGSLQIGCLAGYGFETLMTGLISEVDRFRKNYPDTHISLLFHSFRELREKLLSGDLDIIFSPSFDLDDEPGIHKKPVHEMRVYIVIPAEHRLASRESLNLSDIRNEHFFIMSPSETAGGANLAIKRCREAGFTPKHITYVPNLQSLAMAIRQGRGVTICGVEITAGSEGFIKLYETDDLPLDSYIMMAWKSKESRPSVLRFVEEFTVE